MSINKNLLDKKKKKYFYNMGGEGETSEPNNQNPKSTVTGPELFYQICQLGIGRIYYQKEEIAKRPKPKSDDTIGRLERLFNGKPEPDQLIFSPFAIALPVDLEETSHIIIFNDGQIVLVKVFDPNVEATFNEYAKQFSTKHSGSTSMIDEIIKRYQLDRTQWVSLLKQRSNLEYFGNFIVVNPLDNDVSMNIVLEAFARAKETSEVIKRQRKEREKNLWKKVHQILNQDSP